MSRTGNSSPAKVGVPDMMHCAAACNSLTALARLLSCSTATTIVTTTTTTTLLRSSRSRNGFTGQTSASPAGANSQRLRSSRPLPQSSRQSIKNLASGAYISSVYWSRRQTAGEGYHHFEYPTSGSGADEQPHKCNRVRCTSVISLPLVSLYC